MLSNLVIRDRQAHFSKLEPEKSLSAVTASEALREFKINALGHLLTYKHFTPLIPKQKQLDDLLKDGDAAKGLLADRTSLCWSLSARVGSIGANEKGGWYSYRSYAACAGRNLRLTVPAQRLH